MTDLSKAVAWSIIPARGGSKGVPRKNLRKVQGRSLVARAISAALGAQSIARVFVSTEDDAIASEALRAGAEVVRRPVMLSGDTTSSEAVLLDALEQMKKQGEMLPEVLVFQQCTSPFVTPQDIDGTVSTLLLEQADTAHTVTETHGFLWRRTPAAFAEGINHDKRIRQRRQDREPDYIETGAVYAMRTDGFRESGHRFFGRTALYVTAPERALEIDTLQDLAIARSLAPVVENGLSCVLPHPLTGLVFDFDGVMTDDRVLVSQDGNESVFCSRSDGMGLAMLREHGLRLAVISRESNPVVLRRCEKLGIECFGNSHDKIQVLLHLCRSWGCKPENIIFTGNDVPDIPCLEAAGLGVVVADAHPEAAAEAGLVLTKNGGYGAVRELCDIVLKSLKRKPSEGN